MKSATFFGSKSVYYEENAKIQQKIVDETIKFAKNNNVLQPQNELFLDLGSGTGLVKKKLSENFEKINIISLDISPCALEKCENCVCGDFDELPFTDNSFDKIISCSALQWSKNIERVIKNSFDALKVGKNLIIAVFGNETLQNLQVLQKKFGIKSSVSFCNKKEFEEIIQKTGFKIIAKDEKTFSQKFENAYAALKNISKIGATSHEGKILSPKILKDFVSQYEKLFLDGEIIHDYQTFFYILEKK
ncbi:MAG: methyltransferase domain-containing protein [Chitinivibrionia bacterium]|nr:methyltransferase domain-containing protein [Chitinivibrionia bacterium]